MAVCSCGKKAVIPLFVGVREWGLCEDHLTRWGEFPFIYIDGLSTDAIRYFQENQHRVRHGKPFTDVVFSYPTAVIGEGTFTERAKESVVHIAEYMKNLNEHSLKRSKPIVFFGSPFTTMVASTLFENEERAEQYAIHFLRRPAVWVYTGHTRLVPTPVREVMMKANKTHPFTYIRFMVTGKAKQSWWLVFNTALSLWNKSYMSRRTYAMYGGDTE